MLSTVSVLMTGVNSVDEQQWYLMHALLLKEKDIKILVSSQAVFAHKQCNHWHTEQRKKQQNISEKKAFTKKSTFFATFKKRREKVGELSGRFIS